MCVCVSVYWHIGLCCVFGCVCKISPTGGMDGRGGEFPPLTKNSLVSPHLDKFLPTRLSPHQIFIPQQNNNFHVITQ